MLKYTIIWIFIIELASEASPSKLLKIQDEETKIDRHSDWRGLKAIVTDIEGEDVEE